MGMLSFNQHLVVTQYMWNMLGTEEEIQLEENANA